MVTAVPAHAIAHHHAVAASRRLDASIAAAALRATNPALALGPCGILCHFSE